MEPNIVEGYLIETFDGDKNIIISMNSNADYDIVDAGIDAFVGGAASKFTAQTISATGQAATTGVINTIGNSNTPSQQNNRFMYRPFVAQQDQTRVQLPNN